MVITKKKYKLRKTNKRSKYTKSRGEEEVEAGVEVYLKNALLYTDL